jgi:HPt (histidine-containing phosphotransfer) domain-containing protein
MDAFVGKPLTPEKLRKILIAAGRRLLTAASVQAPPDAHTPAINLSLLGYLSDGTEQGLEAQVERFLAALAEAEDQLARVAAERDFNALGDAAHHVLSQAKLIGCVALEETAVALEQAARAQHATAFGALLSRVHREIAALTEALHRRPHAAHSG